MKAFLLIIALACQALAQLQFVNTSFDHPVTVGQMWQISWTTGDGLPVSLSIGNTSWSVPIFVQRSVLPNTFNWLVSAPGNIVTGEYQLGLGQQGTEPGNAGFIWSPRFIINVPTGSPTSFTSALTTLPPAASTGVIPAFPIAAAGTGAVSTVTLTYVFWDHQCGCTKTQTAASPLNTAMAATTYSWFEDECSCTKSAVVPVSTISTTWTNYTAPLNPPVPTGSNVSPMRPAGTVASKTMSTVPFNGGSVRTSSSMLGLVALVVAAVFFLIKVA